MYEGEGDEIVDLGYGDMEGTVNEVGDGGKKGGERRERGAMRRIIMQQSINRIGKATTTQWLGRGGSR